MHSIGICILHFEMHNQLYYEIFSILQDSVVSCPVLPNGQVSWTGLTSGSNATYTCHSRYLLIGDQIRTCLSTGMWSGQESSCESMKNMHWNV